MKKNNGKCFLKENTTKIYFYNAIIFQSSFFIEINFPWHITPSILSRSESVSLELQLSFQKMEFAFHSH